MKQLSNYKRVTGYLDKIFNLLNQNYFSGELPKAVITVQSTPKAYGHFTCYDAWHCADKGFKEINIGAGTLDRPIENVTATLLHEMIHEYCFIHQIKDTSRGGSYHNKRFKAEAEQRGLQIDYDSRIGWSITSPTEDLLNFCIENGLTDILIARNDLIGFNPAITRGKGTASTTRRSSYRKHICPGCLSTARTTKDMKLICGECNEVMIMTD
jgi:hypothetical protein